MSLRLQQTRQQLPLLHLPLLRPASVSR